MKRSFLFALLCAAVSACLAQDRRLIPVTLALLWYPQPEDGQFFAAKAEGIYEKHGLDVTIRPGGPQVNVQQLAVGRKRERRVGDLGHQRQLRRAPCLLGGEVLVQRCVREAAHAPEEIELEARHADRLGPKLTRPRDAPTRAV